MITKNRLAKRQFSNPQIAEDGRIVAAEFKLNSKSSLLAIGVYGVSYEGNTLDAGALLNRDKLRKRMLNKLEDIKTKFHEKCTVKMMSKQYLA